MKIIKIKSNNPISANCYILISNEYAAIVDPGVYLSEIKNTLESIKKKLTVTHILLTHGHFDHIYSLSEVTEYTKAKVYIHEADNEMLNDSQKNAYCLFNRGERFFGQADILLHDGDIIKLGSENIKVIHTPGHTKGSVCFYCGNDLLTGDTLFENSYGRCDFYGGDLGAIYNSIKKLSTLPSNITIHPGHGDGCKLSDALENLPF